MESVEDDELGLTLTVLRFRVWLGMGFLKIAAAAALADASVAIVRWLGRARVLFVLRARRHREG